MLRLLAVCGLLTIALSMFEAEFDFGGNNASDYEILLRQQGFPEDDIELFLQEDRDDREKIEDSEEGAEYVSWQEAKGYDDCEEFMWWRKKYGKTESKEGDSEDKKKEWTGNARDEDDRKDDDYEVDQYKPDSGDRRGHHGHHRHQRSHGHHKHHGHHSKHGYHGKKKSKGCSKPKPLSEICAEYECPSIERLNISGCGFEARRVLSAHWVVTLIDTSDMRKGYHEAFWRLFKYIQGANDQSARMTMAVPVINKWLLDDNYQIEGGQMAFYIPSTFQGHPPTPTNYLVNLEKWGDAVIYDRAFGGDRDDPEYYKKQFMALGKALAKVDIKPYPKMSITAGYTRPGRGRQRKEVMLLDDKSM